MTARRGRDVDHAAYERVRSVLRAEEHRMSHRDAATIADTTVWVVRQVRRERGEVQPPTPQKRRSASRLGGIALEDLRIIARALSTTPGAVRLRLRVQEELERRAAA